MNNSNNTSRRQGTKKPSSQASFTFYAYDWSYDEEKYEQSTIRIFGLDEANESVYVFVTGFTPYIYVELPSYIQWTTHKVQMLCDK